MKKSHKLLSLLLALSLLLTAAPLTGFAHAATIVDSGNCGDNLSWTLDSDGMLTISGTGDMSDYDYSSDGYFSTAPWGSSEFNANRIKSVVIKSGVTNISNRAFFKCKKLTSVVMPESLSVIGLCAFEECSGLESVIIPEGVTRIESSAFHRCNSLTDVIIPKSVTYIGASSFAYCKSLKNVMVPDSVTYMGPNVFYGTAWYNTQPDGLVYIGKIAYQYKGTMPDKTEITIKSGTRLIASGAFSRCSGLTSVTIPNSVKSIGSSAFRKCVNLKKIQISDNITIIGDYAFYDTAWYNAQPDGLVYIGKIAYQYKGTMPDNTIITINKDTMAIGSVVFRDCKGLTNITLPYSVRTINAGAFLDCTGLTSITIPDSVTDIRNLAFSGCTGLTSVTIPNSVSNIGNNAFRECSGLTDVYYSGTEAQWKAITIEDGNECLLNVKKIHYNAQNVNNKDNYQRYTSVLSSLKNFVIDLLEGKKWDWEEFEANNLPNFYPYIEYRTDFSDVNPEYAFFDVDNDGIDEMFIRMAHRDASFFDGIYTYKNGKVESVFLLYPYRASAGIVQHNGKYYVKQSSGGVYGSEDIYYSVSNGKLTFIEGVSSDAYGNSYYSISKSGDSYNYSKSNEKKYNEVINRYSDVVDVLNFKLLFSDENPDEKEPDYSVFQEKSYIADIWLNLRDGEDTMESHSISDLLSYSSISTDIFNSLKGNEDFQDGLEEWNELKIVFESPDAVEDLVLKKTDLYEALIFDLIEKVMISEGEEIDNIVLDAVNLSSKGAKYVTKTKGMVDQLLGLVVDPAKDLLSTLKEWQFDPNCETFQNFYAGLNDINDTASKWSDNTFVKNVGLIASFTNDVATFFQRFTNYAMAVEMSDDLVILLKEMKKHTTNDFFKMALQNVINSVGNADYAATVCTLGLAEDSTVSFIKKCFKEVTKGIPVYNALRTGYKVGVAFDNLMFNTSDSIDAYYLAEATRNFVSANKAAIDTFANKYKTSGSEADAGAYVYAVQTYQYVYEIDSEMAANFIQNASEEGLVNRVNKFKQSILNYIFKTDQKSTYDEFCENKDSIIQSITFTFDGLMTSWKYNPNYLKADYPDMYAVYVKKDLSKAINKPIILSASLNTTGETVLNVDFPYCTYNEKTGLYHVLYTSSVLDGVQVKEQAGGASTTKEFAFGKDYTLKMYNEDNWKSFPKAYFVSGYTETHSGNVYTQSARKDVGNPCMPATLSLTKAENGLTIRIAESASVIYKNIKYHIYRKSETEAYKEIAVIDRQMLLCGRDTLYMDQTANDGKSYTYKVISEMMFINGKTLKSADSNEISLKNSKENLWKRPFEMRYVSTTDSVNKQNAIRRVRRQAAPANQTAERVELSWKADTNISGYELYRKASYGTAFKKIADLASDAVCYSDNEIEKGVTYEYLLLPFIKGNDNVIAYCAESFGNGSVEIPAEQSYNITPGDVSGDGQVTAEDARLALRAAVGLENYAEGSAEFLAADATKDGAITAEDARLILRAAVGLETLS